MILILTEVSSFFLFVWFFFLYDRQLVSGYAFSVKMVVAQDTRRHNCIYSIVTGLNCGEDCNDADPTRFTDSERKHRT